MLKQQRVKLSSNNIADIIQANLTRTAVSYKATVINKLF